MTRNHWPLSEMGSNPPGAAQSFKSGMHPATLPSVNVFTQVPALVSKITRGAPGFFFNQLSPDRIHPTFYSVRKGDKRKWQQHKVNSNNKIQFKLSLVTGKTLKSKQFLNLNNYHFILSGVPIVNTRLCLNILYWYFSSSSRTCHKTKWSAWICHPCVV